MSTLARRALAEFVGTAALVCVVVGSGIAAQQLSAHDVGLQLLENSTATVFGLGVLILVFGPVSGAHFNPVVSLADWWLGRRTGSGLSGVDLTAYGLAQVLGAGVGAVSANVMFDLDPIQISRHDRITTGHLVGEVVATAGLVAVVFALARSGRAALSAAAVGAYIGAAYWFTSSTSFANPAVTFGRVWSDTFAGIAPASVPGFLAAQLLGGALGLALIGVLYPDLSAVADDVVVHHAQEPERPAPPMVSEDSKPSVLFVCLHNAGRSQMAAAYLTHLAGDRVEVRSAGSQPAEQVNPVAVQAMREIGIDISTETPKILTADAVQASDVVITMGCGDACPFFPGTRYLDWKLDDPAGQDIDAVRPIRDQIETRIRGLLDELGIPSPA